MVPGAFFPYYIQSCRELVHRPGLPLAEHLPEAVINPVLKQLGITFRERLFTPAVTLWTFLTQVLDPDHSCRQAVARLLAYRTSHGLAPCSPGTGAYCKARGRLPEEVLHQLTRVTGQNLVEQAEPSWLWKGRRVKIVDGTGLSMPDSPKNARAYPKSGKNNFPLLRLVVVFSLAVGTVLDAAIGPFKGKNSGEVSLFRTLVGILQAGEVLVADRLYADFWDIARVLACGADAIMRMHAGRETVWFRGRGHSTANRRIWWQKPQRPSWMTKAEYETIPTWIPLRALRVDVRQRGFRTKRLVLVTTLLDAAAYTLEDIATLYRRRWQAELNLRSLKTQLQMDVLRGKTPEMVRKEVWAHLLVYNAVRTLMAAAAREKGLRPDQVSFTGAWQTVKAFLEPMQRARTRAEKERLWAVILGAIGWHRVGNRPNRYEPRAVKRGPKNYPRLKGSRAEARRRLAKGESDSGKKR